MEITVPEKIDNNRELNPYKGEVYEMYRLWKSLPSFFKYPPKDRKTGTRPTPTEYAGLMGVDDDNILELVEIRTQREFGKRFDTDENTLSIWNKQLSKDTKLEDLRNWSVHLSKNVLAALYNNAIRGGAAHEVKLWFQLVNEWQEKAQVEHKFTPIKDIEHDVIDTTKENQVDQNKEATGGVSIS